ncbi:unnamed protein product [Prorocentrum cordatum]|uniref:Cobyrinic acid a,c-diamide synthase n=1 Tax=Prorocentrum cordatum TaxID=2364126 RepID=A0ABN9RGW5_9DINO|nr:unnamed protein product [Polarella glacialis]
MESPHGTDRAKETPPPCVVVAGVHSGVGKTSVAVGLMVALRRRGLRVQPFKVGPDFLDPMHHAAACETPSVNLDGWMLGRAGCEAAFREACGRSGADVAVVEGVMGLHDGLDGASEAGSTAEVAKWLGAPVLLVVDAWCLSRSAAAMVLGYAAFDPDVPVAGVVFNRVAGDSHAEWLRQAMRFAPAVAHLPVLGCLPRDAGVEASERHLGLTMPGEPGALRLEALGALISGHMEVEALLRLARAPLRQASRGTLGQGGGPLRAAGAPGAAGERLPPVRVGVARDEAFCFYYEDNLQLLQEAGAELVPFSPLVDPALPPDLQALYFGGGYPELHGARLEGNAGFRESVRGFCEAGGLCWAECGGLMYLSRAMTVRAKDDPSTAGGPRLFQMVGVLPFDVAMTDRMAMGYCTARPTPALAALLRLPPGTELRCQQYHFSEVTLDGQPAELVDRQGRGLGLRGVELAAYQARMERPGAAFAPEGAMCRSTVASYCHVHFRAAPGLAEAIVAAARRRLAVVSLLPSGTEALCAIPGAVGRLVAVSAHCDYPPEVLQLHRATRSLVAADGRSSVEVEAEVQRLLSEGVTDFHPVDTDWLRAARPGVVLTQDGCPTCDASASALAGALACAGLGHQRALAVGATTVQGALASLEVIGRAIGEFDAAASARRALERRLDRVALAVEGRCRPRVLGLESVCPLVASGLWLPDMRSRAGAEDALGDEPGAQPRRLRWEDVAGCAADVLVVSCCGRSAAEAAHDVEAHLAPQPGFWQLPAVRRDPPRVYVVDHALFSRPGPRLVDGIEQLAELIHPGSQPRSAARGALRLRSKAEGQGARIEWELVCPRLVTDCAGANVTSSGPWLRVESVSGYAPESAARAVLKGRGGDELLLPELAGPRFGDVWLAQFADGETSWEQLACSKVNGEDVPTPRTRHAAARWGDILMVFGGCSASSGVPLAQLELLHLGTLCWTHGSTTGQEPSPRADPTLVVDEAGGCAVLFGGWDGAEHLADVHALDLRSWCWERVQCDAGPSPRVLHAACAWAGQGMLVHGGRSAGGELLGDLWLLAWGGPAAPWAWEQLSAGDPAVLGPRCAHAAAAVGDALLAAGGDEGGGPGAGCGLFLLRPRRWLPAPALCRPAAGHGLAVLDSGALVWGGSGGAAEDVRESAEAGDPKAVQALAGLKRAAPERRPQATWAMLHRVTTSQGRLQYVDPASGYHVFTATYLRGRPCCGFGCRHCPYGHENVRKGQLAEVVADW